MIRDIIVIIFMLAALIIGYAYFTGKVREGHRPLVPGDSLPVDDNELIRLNED